MDARACDAAGFATVLVPAGGQRSDARAYWLDAGSLAWPGAAADGRYSLHAARNGGLVVRAGMPLAGADRVIRLGAPLDAHPALAGRFTFIGQGPAWRLPMPDAATLPDLLTGQVVLVHEDDAGRVIDATGVQLPGALDDLYAAAVHAPALGATVASGATDFRLWAPTAQRVSVCLHQDALGPAARVLPLQRDAATGVHAVQVPADLSGHYYSYLVDVFVPGVGLVRNRVTDPYSTGLAADSLRSLVIDLDSPASKPAGWDAAPRPAPLASQADMAIYELHVRDFSIGDASVPPAHRGRYLAFTDTASDGMRHLQALSDAGLTDVHLLPVFDFATVPESGCVTPEVPAAAADAEAQQAAVMAVAARDCFNWGYDPYHFNAPEGSYASDAGGGAGRIVEFRQMVMALHRAGLRVGMDVVYNHTTTSGQELSSVLDRVVPGYYHRLDAQGAVEQSTCCDNTATEHAMMARLMIDSAVLWATQYRIDSFRFDLMGHQPRAAMEALRDQVDAAAGRHVNLIGEGWNFGEVADGRRFVQASQLSLPGSGIATFSDRARDALRGGGPGDSGQALVQRQGWLNGLVHAPNAWAPRRPLDDLRQAADLVRVGLAGSLRDYPMRTRQGVVAPLRAIDYNGQPAGYASAPAEVVNYVENHDNQTLFDNNAYKLPRGTSAADRARVQVLGLAVTSFSQGVAYFHAGVDTLRSKSMDGNSYDSGDWFNRLDWTYRANHFGTGLPPKADNGRNYPLIAPLLRDAARIRPAPADIAFTRDAFRDLLRIRDSSTLFRLRTAADVGQRLRFHNTGPAQDPLVLVGQLDGRGYPGAEFSEVLYLVNAGTGPRTVRIDDARGRRYVLHPVHRAAQAADPRPRAARFDPATGVVTVPARTAVVYVIE